MDDSLVVGRDQAGDRGNVRSGQNLLSVKFEAFFAIKGVEDLCRCTNSLNLGGDAAAAVLVLERRWRTQFSTRMRRPPRSVDDDGSPAMIRRDGAAKCIDCSTVLTFSVKLKVLSVARHRWRSSSNIWSPSARIILNLALSRFFCFLCAYATNFSISLR